MRPTAAALALVLSLVPAAARAQEKPLPPQEQAPVDPDDPDAVARARIERALDTRLPAVQLEDTPLEHVLAFLRDAAELDPVLDPDAPRDHTVTLSGRDLTARHVLDRALEGSGVQMRIFAGALVFTRPGKDLGDPPRLGDDPVARAVAERRVSLSLDDELLAEALDVIADMASVEVSVTPAAEKRVDAATTSLSLRDAALPHALTLLTHFHGLTWRLEGAGVVIDVRRPRERLVAPLSEPTGDLTKAELEARLSAHVTVSLVEGTLQELATQLEQRARLRVRLENAGKDDVVDLELQDVAVRDLLDIVCDVHGARWTIEEGVVVLQVVPRCAECGDPRGNVSPCPSCGAR